MISNVNILLEHDVNTFALVISYVNIISKARCEHVSSVISNIMKAPLILVSDITESH